MHGEFGCPLAQQKISMLENGGKFNVRLSIALEDCAVDFVEMGFSFFGVHLGKKKLGR